MCNENCNCANKELSPQSLRDEFKKETGLDYYDNIEVYTGWLEKGLYHGYLLSDKGYVLHDKEYIDKVNQELMQASESEINKIIENEL